jgi:putative NADH-flavin reductase
MNISIFGADGRTGIEVVRYAQDKGHNVTAFVYNKNSETLFPEGIKIIQGNVLQYEEVRGAINGSDAIISVVGHIKGSDPLMQTKGMKNIVNAMQECGVKRVLSLTGTGVRIDGDKPSFLDRILNMAVGFVDPNRLRDGIEHAKILQNSNLDWTIVRVLKLSKSDKPFKDYELTNGGPAEPLTSRKKVARALVDLVGDRKFIHKMPVISKL